ncbi:MAG: hypothetical protein ACK56F_00105, partial [bacterium]
MQHRAERQSHQRVVGGRQHHTTLIHHQGAQHLLPGGRFLHLSLQGVERFVAGEVGAQLPVHLIGFVAQLAPPLVVRHHPGHQGQQGG